MTDALEKLLAEQIDYGMQSGKRLAIKYAAKTLRESADQMEAESVETEDYRRGLREAAVFIEMFNNATGKDQA